MISRFFLWQRFSSFLDSFPLLGPQTDDDMWLEREKSRNHALIAIIISYEWGGNFVSAFWSFTYVCGESSGGWMRWNKRGRKRRKRRILLLTLKRFINSLRWKRLIIVNFNFSLPFDPFFFWFLYKTIDSIEDCAASGWGRESSVSIDSRTFHRYSVGRESRWKDF